MYIPHIDGQMYATQLIDEASLRHLWRQRGCRSMEPFIHWCPIVDVVISYKPIGVSFV